jgi:O-acetyl-ADP-ribose deacetylase
MQREYEVLGRRLQLHLGDITCLDVDAIVNSENSDLLMDEAGGPSVSGAIRAIEGEAMAEALARMGPLSPGRAVVLPAQRLPCKWVIHAASVVQTEEGHASSAQVIRDSVRSSMSLAAGLGLTSLAFPAFGVRAASVPRAEASQVMVEELVRGLQEQTPLRRVVVALLDPESFLAFFEEAMVRATQANQPLELRVGREAGRLAWSLVEGGPLGRVTDLEDGGLDEVLARVERLRDAATRRLLDPAQELRGLGAAVRRLIPPQIQEQMRAAAPRPLLVHLDEELAALPLELSWDGEAHLVDRMPVSRTLLTRASQPGGRGDGRPENPTLGRLSALVLVGPQADLPAASAEAEAVLDLLWRRAGDRAHLRLLGGQRATTGEALRGLEEVDLLHWCGHTRRDGDGQPVWSLAGGDLTPEQVASVRSRARLVVANSCGPVDVSLARALLLAGAHNVVATQWDVDDALARTFALRLYEELVLGRTLGEALSAARASLRAREASPETSYQWAAYQHYGDPRERLFEPRGLD